MSLFDDLLDEYEGAQREALASTIASARRALPGAVEVIAWGMPTLRAGDASGPSLLSVMGFSKHNSLFPHSGGVTRALGDAMADYPMTKGTIHFDRDRAFPSALLKRILRVRIDEINADYPRKSGEFREYYDNGFAKSLGRMKGDAMTGAWRWYRRDGSLMRSGAFGTGQRAGTQVGEWITYDRTGAPHRVTDFGKGR